MTNAQFDVEEKFNEAILYINCPVEQHLDIKKSLCKYAELNCPHGADLTGWLVWNAEQSMKEAGTRLLNGEDSNQVVSDFRDRSKNNFHY